MDCAAGVDYGVRRVALAVIDAGGHRVDEVLLGECGDVDAIDTLAESCWNVLTREHADVVVVEYPIVGMSRNLRVGIRMGMVAGAIIAASRQAGCEVTTVEPATWKKAVIGAGNASKDDVANWLARHHPTYHSACASQDTIDATCLALYATTQMA